MIPILAVVAQVVDVEPFLNPQTGFLAFAVTALIYVAWQLRKSYEDRLKSATETHVANMEAAASANAAALAASNLRAEEWKAQALAAAQVNVDNARALEQNNQAIDAAVDRIAALATAFAERRTPDPTRTPRVDRRRAKGPGP